MSADAALAGASTAPASRIEFFFNPGCPWTWATSRWLVEVAGQREIEIVWRSLSLAVLNEGQDIPDEYVSLMAVAAQVHRVFAALAQDGRNDLVGGVYTKYGRQVHHDGLTPTVDLLRDILGKAGALDYSGAIDDERWDESVTASTNKAVSLAGPDVGSPVMAFGTPLSAVSGPIISPPPTGEDAARLFDLVLASADVPGFFELKRGRSDGPAFGPRP